VLYQKIIFGGKYSQASA